MEWVETTGKTVEEAKEAALDQLGVDENDAEFEVLEEPRSGLFGRLRQEARVRARVRPTQPRPKQDRRDRRSRTRKRRDGSPERPASERSASERPAAERPSERPARERSGTGGRRERPRPSTPKEEAPVSEDELSVEEQAGVVQSFLDGLIDAFGFDADATTEVVDDEAIEARIEGEDLGLLIGPRGQTLSAVQELARTVVQRHSIGARHGRVNVDVAGYRERRRAALERFTQQVAEEVAASGNARALEPMGPADRKIVHDTVNDIDGVGTMSEGEEPRRRVVIVPADGD